MTPELIVTWHPAGVAREKARASRSFLLHLEKAANVLRGTRMDRPPEVLIDPPDERLDRWREFAVDIETPIVDSWRVLCVAAATADLALVWHLEGRAAPRTLKRLLAGDSLKLFHNAAFDLPRLERLGYAVAEPIWDTMVEAAIRFPDEPVSLGHLCGWALNVRPWKALRRDDPFARELYPKAPSDGLAYYCGLDACYTARLKRAMREAQR